MENLIVIHEECKKIFERELVEIDGGRSLACKMWDLMTEGKENCDNCLGENFNQLIQAIRNDFFENYTPSTNTGLNFYFTTYILWLYLIVERVDFVFDVINKDNRSKLFSDFKENNFQTCRLVKKWANFIKHPKEFIFAHWPQYVMQEVEVISGTVVIDNAFVEKNYSKSDSRVPGLENNNNVLVVIPELEGLTSQFCSELNVFFNFICDNKVVSDFLGKKTTIESYYEHNEQVL
jgi:hypothetical protein